MIVDHVNIPVSDLERSKRFYEAVLAPLGCAFILRDGRADGFGRGIWSFGIIESRSSFPALHLAFSADSRDAVQRFFHAALAAGGRPNGEPGLRDVYGPGYYAAFVLDPDGHNIEAVFRE